MIHGYFWLGRILPTSMEASPSEQFVVRLLGADQSDSKTRVRRIEKFRKRNKTNFHINDWIFLKFGKLDGFPRISWNHVYIWGDVRDRYWRITRYCLIICIYLLVFVVYNSAPKARYNYRFKITSSSSARYFTRWFESRWCTDVEGFRFAITYDCGRTIQIGVFQLAPRLAIEQNRKCNDQDLVNGLLIARPVVLRSLR